jgi:uncharacterized protein YdhG (YjbR/CyaY superfamily)
MIDRNASVDDYLAALTEPDRRALESLRQRIKKLVPEATEVISYQIPVFRYQGRSLVGFGAAKDQCTFFLMSTSIMRSFKEDLKGYEVGKGSIKFHSNRPLPSSLVDKLVKARIAENIEMDLKKGKRKTNE